MAPTVKHSGISAGVPSGCQSTNAQRSSSRSPASHSRPAVLLWDMRTSSFDFARASIRRPQLRHTEIGEPQPLDLRGPNLVRHRVALKLDGTVTMALAEIPRHRCAPSRTHRDEAQEVLVLLESHGRVDAVRGVTARTGAAPSSRLFEERPDVDPKCVRKRMYVRERDVALATLDGTDIGAMEPGAGGQLLLRYPGLEAESPKPDTEISAPVAGCLIRVAPCHCRADRRRVAYFASTDFASRALPSLPSPTKSPSSAATRSTTPTPI